MKRLTTFERPAVLVALTVLSGLIMLLAAQEVLASGGGGVSTQKFWDFVWRAWNFLVLFIALFLLLRKPAAKFFAGRRANIAETLSDLERKKAQAEDRYREMEAKLADLAGEREKILAEYVKAGEEERDRIIAHAREMAERIKKQAEVTIAQEINSAKAALRKEVAASAAALAEDLIKQKMTDQDQDRLVEEYISKVVPN
ncbi:MAG: F0F1 ATP synthase subunit B [Thermodesulfobacteriota bacterium]